MSNLSSIDIPAFQNLDVERESDYSKWVKCRKAILAKKALTGSMKSDCEAYHTFLKKINFNPSGAVLLNLDEDIDILDELRYSDVVVEHDFSSEDVMDSESDSDGSIGEDLGVQLYNLDEIDDIKML